jgi:hypothetical protein
MKRHRSNTVASLMLRTICSLTLIAAPVNEARAFQVPTLDQIVAHNEDAVGGSDAIKHIQALRLTSSTALGDDPAKIPLTITVQRPNLARTDTIYQGKTMSTGFDGSTAWTLNPSTGVAEPLVLDKTASSSFASFQIDVLLGSLRGISAGQQLLFVGTEEVLGFKTFHIRATRSDGMVSDYFVDQTTFLIVKSAARIMQGASEQDVESYPADYRKVDGITMSYSLDVRVAGHSVFQMAVQRIELNPMLDDNVFSMTSVNKPTVK